MLSRTYYPEDCGAATALKDMAVTSPRNFLPGNIHLKSLWLRHCHKDKPICEEWRWLLWWWHGAIVDISQGSETTFFTSRLNLKGGEWDFQWGLWKSTIFSGNRNKEAIFFLNTKITQGNEVGDTNILHLLRFYPGRPWRKVTKQKGRKEFHSSVCCVVAEITASHSVTA
jgi:hypothetical protein